MTGAPGDGDGDDYGDDVDDDVDDDDSDGGAAVVTGAPGQTDADDGDNDDDGGDGDDDANDLASFPALYQKPPGRSYRSAPSVWRRLSACRARPQAAPLLAPASAGAGCKM